MKNLWLGIILLVACGLRGGLLVTALVNDGAIETPDSQAYRGLAESIVSRGEFRREGQPEIFRTPGYPLFLGITERIGGRAGALATQVFLDVVLVGLTYVLARLLVGHKVALLAAALQALSPLAIAGCCRMLSDSLCALLLTAAVLALVAHLKRARLWLAPFALQA